MSEAPEAQEVGAKDASKVSTASKPRTGPSLRRILLLQLALLPLLLVAADFAVAWAKDYDRVETRQRVRELIESVQSGVPLPGNTGAVGRSIRSKLRVHPFTGFGPARLIESHTEELALARETTSGSEYRVLILGGSVAAGFGSEDSAGIAELRRRLLEDPRFEGREIRFISQGYGSYKQPQQLMLASYLLGCGVRPHAVVSIDGFNEVTLSLQNSAGGVSPTYPAFAQWVHLTTRWGSNIDAMVEAMNDIRVAREDCVRIAEQSESLGLHNSSILGLQVLGRLERAKREYTAASQRYSSLLLLTNELGPLAGPEFRSGDEAGIQDSVRMWEQSTRSLEAICAKRGIAFMNVLQPSLLDRGSKVLTPLEQEKGNSFPKWVTGVELGYPKLREASKRLRDEGIHSVDATGVFEHESGSLYSDACHFSQAGHQVLGRFVAEALLRRLPAQLDEPRF